jgi:hypothetical protein
MTIIFSISKRQPFLAFFRRLLFGHISTHVSFGIEIDGFPIIFHMSNKGAIRTPRARFERKNTIVKEYRVLPDLSEELTAHLKYLGAKYDNLSLIAHYVALTVRPIKQLLIFFKIRNGFYCSNFARQLDGNDKLKAWRAIDKNWASVDELQVACENNKDEFQEVVHVEQ